MHLCYARFLRLAVLPAIFFTLILWKHRSSSRIKPPNILPLPEVLNIPPSSVQTIWSEEECPFSSSVPDRHESMEFTRFVVRPRFVETPRRSLSRISHPLIPPFEQNDNNAQVPTRSRTCRALPITTLDVNPDPSFNLTRHILFGVATTADRLFRSRSSFFHLLAGLNANLLVLVPPKDATPEIQSKFHSIHPSITLLPSSLPFTQRYFSLIQAFSTHLLPTTTHVIFLDDDTFISSPIHLFSRLTTHYPSSSLSYIGARSESSWQLFRQGRHHAYGGASIILSRSLLLTLNAFYPFCSTQRWGAPGDLHLESCIVHAAPNVTLEQWPELHQWDMYGNPDGLFESGRPIWSFHHWKGKGWFRRDVEQMVGVVGVAGEDALLRRWVFNVSTSSDSALPPSSSSSPSKDIRSFFILTNGYSIAQYTIHQPESNLNLDLGKIQHSWDNAHHRYEDSLGPLRENDRLVPGLSVRRWLLKRTWIDEQRAGNAHQIYINGEGDERSVIEVVWLKQRQQ